MNLENEVIQVNLDDIIPNRFQPRIAFDETGLKELADSIKEHGIIQPLVLRKLGNKYEIIAGERRYKAATLAGLVTVPAIISNIDDNKSAEVALVENIQRRDLTPIEEAKSYKSLLDKGYLTQEQLAKRMGISQSAVANKLRLLNLADEVQQALLSEKISERHARALLQVQDKTKQKEWLNRVINERLTVRQLDQEIKKTLNDETENGDIPVISLEPSVEEIKNNAVDLQTIKPTMDFMNPSSNDFNQRADETGILNENNKFFNFNPPEILNTNSNSKDLEIIDMPELQKPIVEEEIKPTDSETEPLFNESSINLSTNNKFFTPFLDEQAPLQEILTPKQDVVVNPMDNVSFLAANEPLEIEKADVEVDNKTNNLKENNSLTSAINKTRELVEDLKAQGININIEELDLLNQYKINITIEK